VGEGAPIFTSDFSVRHPQRLRSLEIDDEFVFGRLLDRQVSRFVASATGIDAELRYVSAALDP
jgi:hypothetical protein